MAVMSLNTISCFKRVGGEKIGDFCEGKLIKYGNSPLVPVGGKL